MQQQEIVAIAKVAHKSPMAAFAASHMAKPKKQKTPKIRKK